MTHYWRIKRWLPDRFGQECKINAKGAKGTIEVEFEDGFKAITRRYFVRRLDAQSPASSSPAPDS